MRTKPPSEVSVTFEPAGTKPVVVLTACACQTMVLSGILSNHMERVKPSFGLILRNPKAKSPEGDLHELENFWDSEAVRDSPTRTDPLMMF